MIKRTIKRTIKRITPLIFIPLSFALLLGANEKTDIKKEEKKLMSLEMNLSKTASQNGILEAFQPFVTNESVLLPLFGHPIAGKAACDELLKDKSKQKHTLRWEPLWVNVSTAGDLAVTHGRFITPPPASEKNENSPEKKKSEEIKYGYYMTVWKKGENGWTIAVSQGLINIKDTNQPVPPNLLKPEALDDVTGEVVKTERNFSAHSSREGILKSFYQYIADDGRALSHSGPPNTKQAYATAIEKEANKVRAVNELQSERKLTWHPIYAFVSQSGKTAYDYGPYVYLETSADGRSTESHGYFVTVWEKQADQSWKFIMDGGNQSPKPEHKASVF